MRIVSIVLLAATLAACNRKVEVNTAPTPASNVAVNLTNNASQAVNAYVTSGGNDVFIGQVPANGSKLLAVSGMASGTVVTLKARTIDGSRTYTKDNVSLSSSYDWTVP